RRRAPRGGRGRGPAGVCPGRIGGVRGAGPATGPGQLGQGGPVDPVPGDGRDPAAGDGPQGGGAAGPPGAGGPGAPRQPAPARGVAVRRPPSSRATSPTTAPGPSSVTVTPSISTARTPSNRRYSSLPGSPWATRVAPLRSRIQWGAAPTMTWDSSRSRAVSTAVARTGGSRAPHGGNGSQG